MKKYKIPLRLILILLSTGYCIAQNNVLKPDLSKVVKGDGWKIINRKASVLKVDGNPAIYLDGQPGDGIVWLEGLEFHNGTIEVDIKGKDVQGSSFVGIAFRGVDTMTYDAIYFRPFNFLSPDSVRQSHGVQYISHPKNTWEHLREAFPGKYENRIKNVSDPNSFFHAKITIQNPTITVLVNNSNDPSLTVKELSGRKGGMIGLWVGNYSDGTFMNLKIVKND